MLSDYLPVTTTKTHDAYDGVPLATLSSKARGDIMEVVAMRIMEEKMGEKAQTPTSGTCVNGSKRGRNSEEYDFLIAGRRVEVKSAQLKWNTHKRYWWVNWQHIKRDAYDDLLLVLYTPLGVYLFLHDHTYGVTTNGKSQHACGGSIYVWGRRNEACVSVTLDFILGKLNHMHYATLAYS